MTDPFKINAKEAYDISINSIDPINQLFEEKLSDIFARIRYNAKRGHTELQVMLSLTDLVIFERLDKEFTTNGYKVSDLQEATSSSATFLISWAFPKPQLKVVRDL